MPERDQVALAEALETYLFDEDAIASARANVNRVRESFTWDKALAPLVEFCRDPKSAADKQPTKKLRKGRSGSRIPSGLPKARSSRSTGLRRDFERAAYYFQQGGPSAVIERVRARKDRNQAANE
ncbi:hypothetical protein JF66_22495 [Cryobacterium sp. MLB-32]|nr:hypothetical protein JF66_22495 [Cryobacterium sp. MLB-32]